MLWCCYCTAREGVESTADQSGTHTPCGKFNLPIHLIDNQIFETGIPGINTYADLFDYVDRSTGPHVPLLAKLAGYTSNWIEGPVKQFGRAIFLTCSISHLKDGLHAGRCFIPLEVL